MKSGSDHRIEPSELSPETLGQLVEMVNDRRRPALVGSKGERIELPDALRDLLVFVVEALRRRQALLLMPEEEALTTQAAARLLGVSRPYLLRLLDAGRIPFYRVGSHRRIRSGDLFSYRRERDAERHRRLNRLSDAVEHAGVYDRT